MPKHVFKGPGSSRWGRLKCLLGLHDWRYHPSSIQLEMMGDYCTRCGAERWEY